MKYVVQFIPIYAKIPEAICRDIDRACARFWWGDTNLKSKMHLAQWKSLCKPKDRGGLGFRQLVSFNKVLLTKQVWRILHNPDALMSRVLKARYFWNQTVMEAKAGSNPSYIWRSICWSRSIMHRGLRWKVNDGNDINIGMDSFVPNFPPGTNILKHIYDWNIKV